MKPGDLVRTPNVARTQAPRRGPVVQWWWCDKVGIIVRKAIPDSTGARRTRCWHVMIDTQTANLREDHLELLNEAR